MTLQELQRNYYFHDSCPSSIIYDPEQQTLTIQMDFCFWAQEGYKEGEPENGPLTLTFHDVSGYEGPTGGSDCWGILDAECDGDGFFISMDDPIHGGYYELRIHAESATVTL